MRQLVTTLRRVVWLACACLCLSGPPATAAESALKIDLDGDGRADLITFDDGQPSVLHVWLSSTATTQTIRSAIPVVQVVATDLDGDHRLEIIARGGTGLEIWMHGRRGFRTYRPKRIVPGAIGHPSRRQFDDGPTAPATAVAGQRTSDPSLTAVPDRAVAPTGRRAWRQPRSRAPDCQVVLWHAAPRPPPSSIPGAQNFS
jgi:hypothetical protein